MLISEVALATEGPAARYEAVLAIDEALAAELGTPEARRDGATNKSLRLPFSSAPAVLEHMDNPADHPAIATRSAPRGLLATAAATGAHCTSVSQYTPPSARSRRLGASIEFLEILFMGPEP